ncbi:Hpt domain-containing protein, partial [Coleofasciculus sp. C1-SOL-03]|uniref:Hpt domain-containing protein n=1 Tax=Coleofasciculus sp. C1-SOL-03 TaxID=3069522 RepID=UPI004063B8DC
MQSEQQQRIMGYFMEEAQDHLNTIEQGLLNLQSTIEDPETLNEMFRAAHSVKGGAAMLGLNSIHQTAHRLEDYFKVLQDTPIQADTQLESLLLHVFDTLSALLNQLQGSDGLTDETASPIMSDAEPVFVQLNSYLQQLVQNSQATGDTPSPAHSSQSSSKGTKTLPATFKRDVLVELREMLQLYKQSDTPKHRHALQNHCQRLIELGDRLDLPGWGELLEISKRAIANPENSYRLLASVTIKEIKQAQELVLTGRSAEIVPSEQLKALAPDATTVESETESDISTHSPTQESDRFDHRDTYIQAEDTYIQNPNDTGDPRGDKLQFSAVPSSNSIPPLSEKGEPEVGIAELNSLADIFETQTADLDQTWHEEEVISPDDQSLDLDADDWLDLEDANDFSDLIDESDELGHSTPDDQLMEGLTDEFDLDAIANPQASTESPDSFNISSSLTDDFSGQLFESDTSEESDPMSYSGEDLNGLFGESFFEEEGETATGGMFSHSDFEDLDVEDVPQSSIQDDETASESDFDFDDLLEISSTEDEAQTWGESTNQNDFDLEDYLESSDLDQETDLDSTDQADIDIESATATGDVSNPFEETSLDDFDQDGWEDAENLPDFEALNDFFDSEPGVESTPVDNVTDPEHASIIELPTSTDEALNESSSSTQDEILPDVTEDGEDFWAEEGEESFGSAAQVDDLDDDWLIGESLGTQQLETSETESAADLFGDWETSPAPSNQELDDLFAEDSEESLGASAQLDDLDEDWFTDESPQTPQAETSDSAADLFGDEEIRETASGEAVDDLFAQEEEEAATPSTELDDLDEDWFTDESPQTPQAEPSDSAADLFGDEEIRETPSGEEVDDLFAQEEEEAAPSAQVEDLDDDWFTDEFPQTPQAEISDSAADLFGDWDIPETAPSEELDDLFAQVDGAELAPSAESEDLDDDWFTDESPQTPQAETSDTAADLFGDEEILETPSGEEVDDLFAQEEEEAAPSAESEDLDGDWFTDESPQTPQAETSDIPTDVWDEWDIPETVPGEDLDDLFAQEETQATPSAQVEDLDDDWLTDESAQTPQAETSDSAADLFGDWDIPETAPGEDLDELFAEEEETTPSAQVEELDEDWLTDESAQAPQAEPSDSAADLFGDWDIPET